MNTNERGIDVAECEDCGEKDRRIAELEDALSARESELDAVVASLAESDDRIAELERAIESAKDEIDNAIDYAKNAEALLDV